MIILLTEKPALNGYIESLILAYQQAGHTVVCDPSNFYHSNLVPDVLHIHWPERLTYWYGPFQGKPAAEQIAAATRRLQWYREQGTKTVLTVHNLSPHEGSSESDPAYGQFFQYADVVVHHCEESVRQATQRYPELRDKKNIVCAHGDYLVHYRHVERGKARRQLGVPDSAFVLLNFGRQRGYKNEQFLLDVFRQANIQNKYLMVVGSFDQGRGSMWEKWRFKLRNAWRERFPYSDRKFVYRAISNEEMPAFLSASNVVLLGHAKGLNSGLLPLAATFSVPAVYPRLGCFESSLAGWCGDAYTPGSVTDACRALECLASDIKEGRVSLDNSAWLKSNSWPEHVARILGALRAG